MIRRPPRPTLFPSPTLFRPIPLLHRLRRSDGESRLWNAILTPVLKRPLVSAVAATALLVALAIPALGLKTANSGMTDLPRDMRSEEHTSELQSRQYLVCRLL